MKVYIVQILTFTIENEPDNLILQNIKSLRRHMLICNNKHNFAQNFPMKYESVDGYLINDIEEIFHKIS